MNIKIWTDGSINRSKNNKCSYAYLIKIDDEFFIEDYQEILSGQRTGNVAEITAIIKALQYINSLIEQSDVNRLECHITVYSDSQYCVKGINEWVHNWRLVNYQKTKNVELWKTLYELAHQRKYGSLYFQWIRGHSGIPENERVDELCKRITVHG
jgi:ribonuclease HI